MVQGCSPSLQRAPLAPAPPLPTWQHPGKPPGLLPSGSSPSFLLSSAEGSWDNGWGDQENWRGQRSRCRRRRGHGGERHGQRSPSFSQAPPSPPCSPRGPWPQEQCLLLCAGCESRPPDRRMLLTESWKWFRQWLGPFRTGRRGQSRENKSDLASCAEAGPLFANGHVLRSSPAWESCKTSAKPGAKPSPPRAAPRLPHPALLLRQSRKDEEQNTTAALGQLRTRPPQKSPLHAQRVAGQGVRALLRGQHRSPSCAVPPERVGSEPRGRARVVVRRRGGARTHRQADRRTSAAH